ncbi:MAG: hypothetical protein WDA16_08340 [Candidatus Thermoplasmatota archaeon]
MTHELRMPPTARPFERSRGTFDFNPAYDLCLMTYRGPRPMGPRVQRVDATNTDIRVTTRDGRALSFPGHMLYARDDTNHQVLVRRAPPPETSPHPDLDEAERSPAKADQFPLYT